jgi:hypothetical protein
LKQTVEVATSNSEFQGKKFIGSLFYKTIYSCT